MIPVPFLDVVLGEPAQTLVAQLGDPLFVGESRATDVPTSELLYFAPSGNAVEYVQIARGNVVGVRVQAAPRLRIPGAMPSARGVTLGGPATQLATLPKSEITYKSRVEGGGVYTVYRHAGILYGFIAQSGVVRQLTVRLPDDVAEKLPAAPNAQLHSGTRPDDAIVVQASNETLGNEKIGAFLSAQSCGDGGYWKPTGYGTPTAYDARPMAKVPAVCTAGGAQQTFYFDVKSFFGKAQ